MAERKRTGKPKLELVKDGGKKPAARKTSRRSAHVKTRRASKGGRGHRHVIDWGAAYAYFVTLGPGERDYASVAREFGVSDGAVRKHAHAEDWDQRAREDDAARIVKVMADEEPNRQTRLGLLLRATQAASTDVLEGIRLGRIRATINDVVALARLAELVEGEPTERFAAEIAAEVANLPDSELALELAQLRRAGDVVRDPASPPPRELLTSRAVEDAPPEEAPAPAARGQAPPEELGGSPEGEAPDFPPEPGGPDLRRGS